MRDPNRIKPFCDQLAELWKDNCPDLRFTQLLSAVLGDGIDRFFVEDDHILMLFQDYFHKQEYRYVNNLHEVLHKKLKDPEIQTNLSDENRKPELLLKSSLSTDEIEDNFKDADLFSSIMAGLKDALDHSRGNAYLKPDGITESWCADANLAMAVKQIAKDEGISQEEALANFKKTRVYNALYDFDTGMWGEGPASLIVLYNKYKNEGL